MICLVTNMLALTLLDIIILLFKGCSTSLPALGREVSAEDSERAKECHVHDAEEHREQGWERHWLERATHERWVQVN